MNSSLRTFGSLAVVGVIAAGPAGAGAARHPSLTVNVRANATLGEQVLVTSSGRTLYRLKPENARHWLCTSRACRQVWHPLLVGSSKTTLRRGPGVSASLKLVTRPDGKLQVAVNRLPVYTYAGDTRAGQANGQRIRSFGGTWLVLRTGALSTPVPTPSPAPTPYPNIAASPTTQSPMPTPTMMPTPSPAPGPYTPGPYTP